MSRMPNSAMEKGNQAVIGIGRRPCISGSSVCEANRLQPMARPNGIPSAMARAKPWITRMAEYCTLPAQVPR
ncbi:hypothetical protein D3C71_1925870 [compost metagenome]